MEDFNNVNSIIKLIAKSKLKNGDTVLDATVGNGNDILYLMKIVGENGFGYGFDIQEVAVKKTRRLLAENAYENNSEIICDGHENLKLYINKKIDFAVFNLGYLPKADHSIITRSDTTIEAIKSIMDILSKTSVIALASYVGHEGGMEEFLAVKSFVQTLDQKKYNVSIFNFLNQKNSPPKLIIIEKRK
ncbi:MAG: class I SAM-dependent methyltransferase [Peptostreptococcus sp.]|uniref:class I SAM-dependent methyltransferase n=1 Tax=Peptostreptococcus sp. TaxID=1262 RepID=UPI002FCA84EA